MRLPLSSGVIMRVVLGVLDRRGAQQVLDQMAMGAVGPSLEASGRRDAVDRRWHREAREVAVEPGEPVAAPGRDDRGTQRGAGIVGRGE